MRPFKVILEHPVYWTLNRRNVTRAFALGLFIAFVPLPIHFLLAALLALAMRLNVPAAVAGTLITNPLTMVPLYYTAYWIGARLLVIPAHPIAIEMSWEWLSTVLPLIWRPFLLGCAVMGIVERSCRLPHHRWALARDIGDEISQAQERERHQKLGKFRIMRAQRPTRSR
jgi:uncharacterized protein (DUF2062 family)